MFFISLEKLFSFSRYLSFCVDFLVMQKNELIRKIIVMIIDGQLIEYNMKNIFLEKSYAKCGGETIPRPFSKKSKLSLSLD